VVIDIDAPQGFESLLQIEETFGQPPETLEVTTGGGGRHLYFRAPKNEKIQSQNAWRPSIDIKAEGGYVLAPPSNHISGRRYEWAEGCGPRDIALAEIPPWLLQLLPRKSDVNGYTFRLTSPDLLSVLQRARDYAAKADHASEGNRNASAFRLAGHLASFGLGLADILQPMAVWNSGNRPPLTDRELQQCIANSLANGTPRADKSASESTPSPHTATAGESLLSDLQPVSRFVQQSHHVEYLIPFALVAAQPGVISARTKSLKTTVAIDANLSMATATPFLGAWPVPAIARCGILSAESGAATIVESIRRIAQAKNIVPEEIDNCLVSSRCPRLQSGAWLDEIRRVIGENQLRCLTIDPTYMAAAGVKQNDLSSVAAMLEPVSRIIVDTGCAIVMVHHNRKVSDMRYGCPTLEEITGSGFAEWSRFWLLLNRRKEWDDTTGRHWLWLVTGGSAGFGSRKWLDVREGKPTDLDGRVWEVEVVPAAEGESRERAERVRQKETRQADDLEADKRKLVDILRKHGPSTVTDMRTIAGMNYTRFRPALSELLDSGDVKPTQVTKGNRQEYTAYMLSEDN
jgi:hypothetical protein